MFPVVILAGGRGDRMGGPKGLMPIGPAGTPLVVWQLQRHRAAGGREAIVVLGHHADRYLAALSELAGPATGVRVALNPQPELGPFGSLRVGLAVVAADLAAERAVFVLPVDVPAAQVSTWAALAQVFLGTTGLAAAVPCVGGRGGHPVLLSADFAHYLCGLDLAAADARLDVQLRALSTDRIARVEVADPLVLENLNTPAAIERFRALI